MAFKKNDEFKHFLNKYQTADNPADKAYSKGRLDQKQADYHKWLFKNDKAKYRQVKQDEHAAKAAKSYELGLSTLGDKHAKKAAYFNGKFKI
jgi:hypothetical protein